MSKIGTCKHNSKVENGAEDEEVQDSIINENDLKATQKNPHFFFFFTYKIHYHQMNYKHKIIQHWSISNPTSKI